MKKPLFISLALCLWNITLNAHDFTTMFENGNRLEFTQIPTKRGYYSMKFGSQLIAEGRLQKVPSSDANTAGTIKWFQVDDSLYLINQNGLVHKFERCCQKLSVLGPISVSKGRTLWLLSKSLIKASPIWNSTLVFDESFRFYSTGLPYADFNDKKKITVDISDKRVLRITQKVDPTDKILMKLSKGKLKREYNIDRVFQRLDSQEKLKDKGPSEVMFAELQDPNLNPIKWKTPFKRPTRRLSKRPTVVVIEEKKEKQETKVLPITQFSDQFEFIKNKDGSVLGRNLQTGAWRVFSVDSSFQEIIVEGEFIIFKHSDRDVLYRQNDLSLYADLPSQDDPSVYSCELLLQNLPHKGQVH